MHSSVQSRAGLLSYKGPALVELFSFIGFVTKTCDLFMRSRSNKKTPHL